MPRWCACAGALALLAFSFLPLEVKERVGTRGFFHGLGHLVAFAVLSALLLWSSRSWRQAALLMVLALGLGLGIECSQAIITGAHIEQLDCMMDAVGVCGVSALYALFVLGRALHRRTKVLRGR